MRPLPAVIVVGAISIAPWSRTTEVGCASVRRSRPRSAANREMSRRGLSPGRSLAAPERAKPRDFASTVRSLACADPRAMSRMSSKLWPATRRRSATRLAVDHRAAAQIRCRQVDVETFQCDIEGAHGAALRHDARVLPAVACCQGDRRVQRAAQWRQDERRERIEIVRRDPQRGIRKPCRIERALPRDRSFADRDFEIVEAPCGIVAAAQARPDPQRAVGNRSRDPEIAVEHPEGVADIGFEAHVAKRPAEGARIGRRRRQRQDRGAAASPSGGHRGRRGRAEQDGPSRGRRD